MKKILTNIICCLLCILMAGVPTFAEGEPTPTMNMSWHGDYTNNKLIIKFTSPADYNQQVSAVMYLPSVGNATPNDYVRVSEAYAPAGVLTTVEFPITNSLSAANGKYKVRLQGSGHMSALCREIQVVTVKTPSLSANLVERINAATTAETMATLISEAKDALQLTVTDDALLLTKLMNALIKTRSLEYENSFANLDEVRDAYLKSEIIVYLHESTSTASGLKERVEKNASLIGFDTTEADYIAKSDVIYNLILSNKTTFKGGINDCGTLVKALEQYRGVSIINAGTLDSLEAALAKYYTDLDITSQHFNKYKAFSAANKDKVNRQVYSKGFSNPAALKKAFEDGVDKLYNAQGEDQGGVGGAGGSLGGGASGPGSVSGGTTNPTTPTTPPTANNGFSDLLESHWSHKFVSQLRVLNVISGYEDGTFLPDKTVSREEFVKMIISATGLLDSTAKCDFSDVKEDAWFYSFAASANKLGIVNGVSATSFGAGTSITREDVSVIAARIIDKLGKTPEKGTQKEFADDSKVSSYAKESIYTLTKLGIINGFEDNSFKPKDALTRAQAAKIIYLIREAI